MREQGMRTDNKAATVKKTFLAVGVFLLLTLAPLPGQNNSKKNPAAEARIQTT